MQSVYFANVSLAKQLYNFTDDDKSLLFTHKVCKSVIVSDVWLIFSLCFNEVYKR